jgi:hypothetical protein
MAEQELPLPYEAPVPQAPMPSADPAAPQAGDQAPPMPYDAGAGVPESGGQAYPDLDKDPRFQKWKSTMDTQLDAVKREQAAITAARQQDALRAQAAEAELDRIRKSSMDEPERLAYERDQAIKIARDANNELAQRRYTDQVRADAEEMATRLGIPSNELLRTFTPQDDPHTRWLKALDLQQQKGARQPQQQQPAPGSYGAQGYYPPPPQVPQGQQYQQPPQPAYNPATSPANRVDTMGGSATQSLDRYNRAYRQAATAGDLSAMLDIEERAGQAGVPIIRINK